MVLILELVRVQLRHVLVIFVVVLVHELVRVLLREISWRRVGRRTQSIFAAFQHSSCMLTQAYTMQNQVAFVCNPCTLNLTLWRGDEPVDGDCFAQVVHHFTSITESLELGWNGSDCTRVFTRTWEHERVNIQWMTEKGQVNPGTLIRHFVNYSLMSGNSVHTFANRFTRISDTNCIGNREYFLAWNSCVVVS